MGRIWGSSKPEEYKEQEGTPEKDQDVDGSPEAGDVDMGMEGKDG